MYYIAFSVKFPPKKYDSHHPIQKNADLTLRFLYHLTWTSLSKPLPLYLSLCISRLEESFSRFFFAASLRCSAMLSK